MQSQQEIAIPPKDNSYRFVNAYNHRPSIQQILTLILFLAIMVMHSIFIIQPILKINFPLLFIMFSLTYCLLIIMIFDYCYLTWVDPVDDLVVGIQKQYKIQELVRCNECRCSVHKQSYHCKICKRCVEYFDHHCKYLNNCIGGKNYTQFFRLLVFATIFCFDIIAQGIWVFTHAQYNPSFNDAILSQWGILSCIIFTFIVMLAIDTLLVFHIYLICVNKTTYRYIMDQPSSESTSQQDGHTANRIKEGG